jgi:hypothetical protein
MSNVKSWSFQCLRKPNVARKHKQMRPAGVTALECVLCHSQRSTKQPNAFRVAEDGVQAGKTTPEAKLTGSHIGEHHDLPSGTFQHGFHKSFGPVLMPLSQARSDSSGSCQKRTKKIQEIQWFTNLHGTTLGWSWMHLNNNIVRILPWICNEH